MGFLGNLRAYTIALLVSPFSQELQSSTERASSSYYADVHYAQRSARAVGIYARQISNSSSKLPSSRGVSNVYNSEFRTTNACNTANKRNMWCNNTTINTDYESVASVPNTGKTNHITLVMTSGNQFCGDGYCRDTMLINGTYPGPLVRGDWGDWFEITVINQLNNCNGTSIHWHGIRQLHTVWEDGVAGVTQCPIAPGQSQTYRWRATQYGTSWYHSHFSLQYPDGIAGPLVIDGPTSKNYDVDKGPLMLTDWYHDDAFSLYYQELMATPPASFLSSVPSVLVNGQGTFTKVVNNGTNVTFGCTKGEDHCEPEKASTYKTDINPSQDTGNVEVYKYRIINMSTATHFSFWIDGHDFWIVATDFVPIIPIKRQFLNVAIGQRYDILIEAKTKADLEKNFHNHPNFWIQMRRCDNYCYGDPCPPGTSCVYVECRQGILSYNSSSPETPDFNSETPKALSNSTDCADPARDQLRPIVVRNLTGEVPSSMVFTNPFEVDRRAGTQHPTEVFGEPTRRQETDVNIWDFGSSHTNPQHPNGSYFSFVIDWANATLGLAGAGIPPSVWNPRFVPIVLDTVDEWTVFAIVANWTKAQNQSVALGQSVPGMAHPIHLHGHDFVILAQSNNTFVYGHSYELDLVNPARRDVVMVPADGYIIIAFKTDNPGTWLMHCHIAWHTSSGLALQWVERPKEIPALMEQVKPEFEGRCQRWREHEVSKCEWSKGLIAEQSDSGI